MAIKRKLLLTVLVFVFAVIFVDIFAGRFMLWQGIPSGDAYLNTYQLLIARYDAENNDLLAVKKLIWFYGNYKNDQVELSKWEKKAAILGDQNYQYKIGMHELEIGNKVQGMDWIKKAAEQGQQNALSVLNKMELQEK